MRSVIVLGGVTTVGLLTVIGVVATLQELWWLVVGTSMLMVGSVLLVALDTDRRVRELRSFIRGQIASIDMTGGRTAPTQDDVVGTVRLLQEQYVARLDRMHEALDQSLARVEINADHGTRRVD